MHRFSIISPSTNLTFKIIWKQLHIPFFLIRVYKTCKIQCNASGLEVGWLFSAVCVVVPYCGAVSRWETTRDLFLRAKKRTENMRKKNHDPYWNICSKYFCEPSILFSLPYEKLSEDLAAFYKAGSDHVSARVWECRHLCQNGGLTSAIFSQSLSLAGFLFKSKSF